jgi:hypothetical protein
MLYNKKISLQKNTFFENLYTKFNRKIEINQIVFLMTKKRIKKQKRDSFNNLVNFFNLRYYIHKGHSSNSKQHLQPRNIHNPHLKSHRTQPPPITQIPSKKISTLSSNLKSKINEYENTSNHLMATFTSLKTKPFPRTTHTPNPQPNITLQQPYTQTVKKTKETLILNRTPITSPKTNPKMSQLFKNVLLTEKPKESINLQKHFVVDQREELIEKIEWILLELKNKSRCKGKEEVERLKRELKELYGRLQGLK